MKVTTLVAFTALGILAMNIDLLCIIAIFPWNRFFMTLQKKKCGDVIIL